jgi:uncharacterized protein YaaQ
MQTTDSINLLALIFVLGRQAEALMHRLVDEKFYFTKFESSGLVFEETWVGLMIGLNNQRMDYLIRVVEQTCPPHQEYIPVQVMPLAGLPPLPMIEARVGGALIYSVEVERFLQV